MAEKFKKHMMYGDGKSKMANTKKQHLNLKAKGWGHTKPKPKSKSPLGLNQSLVRGAARSNFQTGGASSMSGGDWRGDLMTKPILDAMVGKQLSEEEKNKANKTNTSDVKVTRGCTNPKAKNYNADATEDDGSCELKIEIGKNDKKEKVTNQKSTKTKKDVKEVRVEKKKGNFINKLFNKGRYSGEGEKFVEGRKSRDAINKELRRIGKTEGGKDSDEYKALLEKRQAKMYRVKKKGLFNDRTYDEKDLKDYLSDNSLTGGNENRKKINKRGNSDYSGKYYSPLEMNSREKVLRKRSGNSNSHTPFAYKERIDDNTPFYQVEEVKEQSTAKPGDNGIQQGALLDEVAVDGNAFDLMEQFGDLNVGKYIGSMQLLGDEKPPQLLGPSAVEALTGFMNLQKDELYGASKNPTGGQRERNALISNVKSLAVSMNKIGPWMTGNIEAISEDQESKGSSVANTYLRDILITKKTDEQGVPLTTMAVDNDHNLAIKFRGIGQTYDLNSIQENIFPKAFETFETLSQAMKGTMDEAISGLPFNEAGARALVNNALKTQEQILSTIHDEESPMQRILEDFSQAYPNSNMDFFHIDSPNFNIEDVKPIIKDYALKKLRSQHALYAKNKSGVSGLTADQIIKKFSK